MWKAALQEAHHVKHPCWEQEKAAVGKTFQQKSLHAWQRPTSALVPDLQPWLLVSLVLPLWFQSLQLPVLLQLYSGCN